MWVVYYWIDGGLITGNRRGSLGLPARHHDHRRDRSSTAGLGCQFFPHCRTIPQLELNKVHYAGRIGTPTVRIARRRPRRSSACAACAAGFIFARTAIIRYRRRRRNANRRKSKSSSPHRARIRCSTELTRWPDRPDDRHRAGESQNRPAEPRLQHPPAGDAGTDGCRINE